MIQNADAEIARMRRIIAEIDNLETEFEKFKHIRDVVKGLRARVDKADSKLSRTTPVHEQSHGMGDSQRRRNNDQGARTGRRTPPSRSQQCAQPPSSPAVSSSLQVTTIAPLSSSSHPTQTAGPVSTASASHLSMSSPLDNMNSIGKSLQHSVELDEDGSRMLHPQLVPGKATTGESTDPDQHLQREDGDSSLREVPLATSKVVQTSRSSQAQRTGSPTSDAESACPSLSTNSEVGSDSGHSVAPGDYRNFSLDVADQLSTLVKQLVSYWFFQVWPNVRGSTAYPFRSCPSGVAGGSSSSTGTQIEAIPEAKV